MTSTIILIGPIGAGKTTIGHLLADTLGLPLCSIDHVRSTYYEKVGYDTTLAAQIAERGCIPVYPTPDRLTQRSST